MKSRKGEGAPPAVAIIWARYGPYHCARLRGASACLAEAGLGVVGIEVARDDADYAWNVIDGSEADRLTVFEANYSSLSKAEMTGGITDTLDRLDPVAVGINGYAVPEAVAALGWCKRRRRPAILMSETHGYGKRRPWWKEFGKRLRLKGFDAALVGGRVQQDYLQSLGFPRERICFGYNAVDNDYFRLGSEEALADAGATRERLGLPQNYFYANTRFMPRKNLDGLLRAYRMYSSASGQNCWGLVISGGGEEEARLKRLASDLGLESLVHWPGFLQYEDLPAYYGLASAFVHPAKEEAWGLVLNEAAAAGLPILSGERVGARFELVKDGMSGYCFDAHSDEAICAALTRVAALPEGKRRAMGLESQRIVDDWGPERFGLGLREALSLAGIKPGAATKVCEAHPAE